MGQNGLISIFRMLAMAFHFTTDRLINAVFSVAVAGASADMQGVSWRDDSREQQQHEAERRGKAKQV